MRRRLLTSILLLCAATSLCAQSPIEDGEEEDLYYPYWNPEDREVESMPDQQRDTIHRTQYTGASIYFSGRGYLSGARLFAHHVLPHGWAATAHVDGRTGRDIYVDGVFANTLNARVKVEKRRLSLQARMPVSMRSLRSASSREAFDLLDDNLYNPAWGYQNGKVRSARIRREVLPRVEAAYRVEVNATTLDFSASAEVGNRKLSGLSWFNTRTPLPDNYRNMPSYFDDQPLEQQAAEHWRSNDTRYTQIDWERLYAQNFLADDGSAVFAVTDRVERIANIRIHADGKTKLNDCWTAGYLLHGARIESRNYQQMRDLLGADHIVDHDYFLIDDDTYGNQLQNDLRHPDRVVHQGDRFGYDYSMLHHKLDFGGTIHYAVDRWKALLSLRAGVHTVQRVGHYEKELFPGSRSYGKSRLLQFVPYELKLALSHVFTPQHRLELNLRAEACVPRADDLFLNPRYNNRPVDHIGTEKLHAGEITYTLTTQRVDFQLTASLRHLSNGVLTRRYFDDASAQFCNAAAADVATLRRGIEAVAKLRLARRWTCSAAAAWSRYRYIANPTVWVYSDAENQIIDNGSTSYMNNYTVGNVPQITASARVDYFDARGWKFHVEAVYEGSRYVDPALSRRTLRIAHTLAESPEAFALITHQERLPDTFTLDATCSKSIHFNSHRLTFTLSIHNLLGARDQIYAGYESPRTPRYTAGDMYVYRPMPTRYLYAYPRTFYLSATFNL